MLVAYQGGKTDFTTLISTFRQQSDARSAYLQAVNQLLAQKVALEQAAEALCNESFGRALVRVTRVSLRARSALIACPLRWLQQFGERKRAIQQPVITLPTLVRQGQGPELLQLQHSAFRP